MTRRYLREVRDEMGEIVVEHVTDPDVLWLARIADGIGFREIAEARERALSLLKRLGHGAPR